MALAVLVVGGLYELIPSGFRVSVVFQVVFPVVLVVLLATLVVGDPGRIDRASRWLRVTTGVMIGLITVWSVAAVGRLVVGILQKAVFTTPTELLTVGAVTWITNVIAFALWYWYLDQGGPVARAAGRALARPWFASVSRTSRSSSGTAGIPNSWTTSPCRSTRRPRSVSPTSPQSGTGRNCASWRRQGSP
jgi:hypothetical protein